MPCRSLGPPRNGPVHASLRGQGGPSALKGTRGPTPAAAAGRYPHPRGKYGILRSREQNSNWPRGRVMRKRRRGRGRGPQGQPRGRRTPRVRAGREAPTQCTSGTVGREGADEIVAIPLGRNTLSSARGSWPQPRWLVRAMGHLRGVPRWLVRAMGHLRGGQECLSGP